MTNLTAIVVALIAATPPTVAILWSHRKIHAVVNSRLDAALAKIESLQAEIRNLRGVQ
jgi:hypothetical protein